MPKPTVKTSRYIAIPNGLLEYILNTQKHRSAYYVGYFRGLADSNRRATA